MYTYSRSGKRNIFRFFSTVFNEERLIHPEIHRLTLSGIWYTIKQTDAARDKDVDT